MNEGTKVGVVSVTYNSSGVIDEFLASLFSQTYDAFVLYVIDNKSADDTIKQIAQHDDPRLNITANPDNRGIAEGNNQGIRAALEDGCELVLLFNNDTVFGPELLRTLISGLWESGADMVAPKILFHDDETRIWSAGGGLNPHRGYSGFHYGYGELDDGQFDTCRSVEHAPACCLLIRRDVFEQIGLMDERYFAYVEDTDFCYRAKQAGLTIRYCPYARVLHKAHSLTGGLFSEFMMRYTTRNRTYFMLKHFGIMRGLCYVVAYQAYLLSQLLRWQVRLPMFFLRERALFEGLQVWRNRQGFNSRLPM
jgi:GT2 family glycosyltransferase